MGIILTVKIPFEKKNFYGIMDLWSIIKHLISLTIQIKSWWLKEQMNPKGWLFTLECILNIYACDMKVLVASDVKQTPSKYLVCLSVKKMSLVWLNVWSYWARQHLNLREKWPSVFFLFVGYCSDTANTFEGTPWNDRALSCAVSKSGLSPRCPCMYYIIAVTWQR